VGVEKPRGRIAIAIFVALAALVLPARAEAHPRSSVIALDYEARLASGAVAAGVRARVIDGDRKLELTALPPTRAVVQGYGGEPFLRFSPAGVELNLRSPTAVSDRLGPAGVAPAMSPTAGPRWSLLTRGHRFAWHDHRLGPRPDAGGGVGRVASWSIPIVVDGRPQLIRGGLWRAAAPTLWPWVALWLATLATAVALAWRAPRAMRRTAAVGACIACGALLLLVSVGFTFGSARSGVTRWLDLALPASIAAATAAVVFLPRERRQVGAAVAGGFAFAAALGDVSIFRHGFVVSALPQAVVRSGLAAALAAGGLVLAVVLAELWREEPAGTGRPRPRPQPRLAVPKGRAR